MLALTVKRLHASASALTRELLADVLDGAGLRILHAQEATLRDQLAQEVEPSA